MDRWTDETTDDGIQTHKNMSISKIDKAQGGNELLLSGNDSVSYYCFIC